MPLDEKISLNFQFLLFKTLKIDAIFQQNENSPLNG